MNKTLKSLKQIIINNIDKYPILLDGEIKEKRKNSYNRHINDFPLYLKLCDEIGTEFSELFYDYSILFNSHETQSDQSILKEIKKCKISFKVANLVISSPTNFKDISDKEFLLYLDELNFINDLNIKLDFKCSKCGKKIKPVIDLEKETIIIDKCESVDIPDIFSVTLKVDSGKIVFFNDIFSLIGFDFDEKMINQIKKEHSISEFSVNCAFHRKLLTLKYAEHNLIYLFSGQFNPSVLSTKNSIVIRGIDDEHKKENNETYIGKIINKKGTITALNYNDFLLRYNEKYNDMKFLNNKNYIIVDVDNGTYIFNSLYERNIELVNEDLKIINIRKKQDGYY